MLQLPRHLQHSLEKITWRWLVATLSHLEQAKGQRKAEAESCSGEMALSQCPVRSLSSFPRGSVTRPRSTSRRGAKHLSAAPRPGLASPLAPQPRAGPGPQVAAGRGGAGRPAGSSAARMGPHRPTPPLPPPSRAAERCAGPHGLQVSEGSAGPSGRAAGAAVGGGWAAGRASLPSPRLLPRLLVCQHSHGRRLT